MQNFSFFQQNETPQEEEIDQQSKIQNPTQQENIQQEENPLNFDNIQKLLQTRNPELLQQMQNQYVPQMISDKTYNIQQTLKQPQNIQQEKIIVETSDINSQIQNKLNSFLTKEQQILLKDGLHQHNFKKHIIDKINDENKNSTGLKKFLIQNTLLCWNVDPKYKSTIRDRLQFICNVVTTFFHKPNFLAVWQTEELLDYKIFLYVQTEEKQFFNRGIFNINPYGIPQSTQIDLSFTELNFMGLSKNNGIYMGELKHCQTKKKIFEKLCGIITDPVQTIFELNNPTINDIAQILLIQQLLKANQITSNNDLIKYIED